MPVKGASPIKKGKPFYGYTIVLSCFLITAVTFGVNYSFGIFFDPFISEFGWNRAEISLAFALATVLSGFLGIGAGKLPMPSVRGPSIWSAASAWPPVAFL